MSHLQAIHPEERRTRALALLALGALTLLAWACTVQLARGHAAPGVHRHPVAGQGTWTGEDVPALLLMWAVMMTGMMLPSVVPAVLALVGRGRRGLERRHPLVRGLSFAGGYLAVWLAYSTLAALAQSWLQARGLVSPHLQSATPLLGGGLLLAAGTFQFTPMKEACLARCRALVAEARDVGNSDSVHPERSAFRRGVEQGVSSAGSCWALMLVPFATGVMSLPVMALLTAWLLVEHLAPARAGLHRAVGVCLVAWGGWAVFS